MQLQNIDLVSWPLEESLTPAALSHVEAAVRAYVPTVTLPVNLKTELENLANAIRAMLQHVLEERRAATQALPVNSPPVQSPEEWLDT